ncbi:FAD/NAD(P)-binding domain-containing protein, partial [Aureobasidium melanogenum]
MADIQGLREQIAANFKFMEPADDPEIVILKRGRSYHTVIAQTNQCQLDMQGPWIKVLIDQSFYQRTEFKPNQDRLDFIPTDALDDRDNKVEGYIVGAGVAGLSAAIGIKRAGHDPIVLERTKTIAEVGAGIQLAPNNMRLLDRYDVLPEILKYTTLLERTSIRRWKNNEELASAPLMPGVAKLYNSPIGAIHRGDLQRTLLEHAKMDGCDIRVNSRVIKVDDNFEAGVQLKDGSWVRGDLIIAADGIKSNIRHQVAAHHKHVDRATPTGDAAYRILVSRERMQRDPVTLDMISRNAAIRWMEKTGPHGHIVAYPIKNNNIYNMVLNPTVQRLLSYVPENEVIEWTLNSHRPLPFWHQNKVVLVGDACHPMLPYLAQGAAQAIEDAGVLQVVLNKSSTDIGLAIKIYEQVRKARGEAVQASASEVRTALHLPDGPEQRERDYKIRFAGQDKGNNPDLWADKDMQ